MVKQFVRCLRGNENVVGEVYSCICKITQWQQEGVSSSAASNESGWRPQCRILCNSSKNVCLMLRSKPSRYRRTKRHAIALITVSAAVSKKLSEMLWCLWVFSAVKVQIGSPVFIEIPLYWWLDLEGPLPDVLWYKWSVCHTVSDLQVTLLYRVQSCFKGRPLHIMYFHKSLVLWPLLHWLPLFSSH